MTCASELKTYFHNNEDPWKKIGTLSTEIGPAATQIVKFWPKKHISVWVLKTLRMSCESEVFGIMTPQFFSLILVIYGRRLKFQSTAHLECFMYLYWIMLFLAKIWLFWLQQGQFQYLRCQFFFHRSLSLWK